MASIPMRLVEQFDRPARYRYGTTINVVHDIQPETVKTTIPVFFIPGWLATAKGKHRENVLGLAKGGRRCLSLSTAHGIICDPNLRGKIKANEPAMCKVSAVVKAIEERQVTTTDLIAHSEGALIALLVAQVVPERIRHIVLVNPAGLIGPDSFLRLVFQFFSELYHQMLAQSGAQSVENPVMTVLSRFLLSFRQVVAIARSDNSRILKSLSQQGKKIAVIHCTQDRVFPEARMRQVLKSAEVKMHTLEGGHNYLVLYPDHFNCVASAVLDELEHK
jgi:pimeloyl-ACP methyl ester carboxylesterase